MTFKDLLKAQHTTQQQLADACEVHQTLVSQWVKGKSNPSIYKLNAISEFLHTPVETVIECLSESKKQKLNH